MKEYNVFYTNRAESNCVATFETLDAARDFVAHETRGDELCDGDPYTDRAMAYKYEIIAVEPIAETPWYWE